MSSSESDLPPQAGTHGQPGSHISGQTGPEILGGKSFNSIRTISHHSLCKGSASTRILGQSVDEQLRTELPATSEGK